jgi:hypothetical protein
MNNQEKWDAFKEELALIKNETIKQFALNAIVIMPDYFFTMPSSTTGKYHAKYALGEGGLLRHTKALVRIECELFRMDWWNFEDNEKDLLVVSAILHDSWKKGDGTTKWTTDTHPTFAVNAIKKDEIASKILSNEQMDFVFGCMASHSGQWNKDRQGNEILPKPITKYQKFLHMVDYFCSRKCVEINLDVPIVKY